MFCMHLLPKPHFCFGIVHACWCFGTPPAQSELVSAWIACWKNTETTERWRSALARTWHSASAWWPVASGPSKYHQSSNTGFHHWRPKQTSKYREMSDMSFPDFGIAFFSFPEPVIRVFFQRMPHLGTYFLVSKSKTLLPSPSHKMTTFELMSWWMFNRKFHHFTVISCYGKPKSSYIGFQQLCI